MSTFASHGQTPLYEPATPRFAAHKAVYAIDPVTLAPERLFSTSSADEDDQQQQSDLDSRVGRDDATHVNVLVLPHSAAPGKPGGGMVWVWAQVTTSSKGAFADSAPMGSLALGMPPRPGDSRTNASQLVSSGADDPTANIARRLSTKFGRPVYLSLNNAGATTGSLAAAGMGVSVAAERLAALERCLFMELKRVL
ncbi:hypothetical protein GGI11_002259 [Coemansia sp. RSA 2049]|nr:hypothetical protein GGI11_002259 [Coemansia sp. RSA 2049]KAJ2522698.1 hypothetical protein H4217_000589 [Coemansia sp. RSA 1939]KAJ2598410.1 hypothetical protein EV177_007534 [Coemansia sp. RSA 1804]